MTVSVRFSVPLSVLVAGSAVSPTVSLAAEEANESRRGVRSEEVIVTAEKLRSQSLEDRNSAATRLGISALDTPASVQVISGESIRLRGDADIGSALGRATGVTTSASSGGGGFGVTARGFGSGSVTALYDGMKSLINIGDMSYPFDTWNVERIEVINGPASVLHGNGAIGGVFNVVSRKPSHEAHNEVLLSAGSFDRYRAGLDTTGGLTDQLAYRLDVSSFTSDGYTRGGDTKGTAVTASLKFDATDELSFSLTGDYAEREQLVDAGVPLINGRLDRGLRRVNYKSRDAVIPFEDQRLFLLTEWSPSDGIELRNATYYIHGDRMWNYPSRFVHRPTTNDILRSNFTFYQQYQNQLGDHLEVLWKQNILGLENTVSFGGDFSRLFNRRYMNSYSSTDVLDLRNTSPGYFPAGPFTRNYQRTIAHQYAAFAEDHLKLTPKLSVIGGLRYEQTQVEREDLVSKSRASGSFEPWSWRVGAVYELAPQFNLYAQYSTATDSLSYLCCITAPQMSYAMNEGRQTEVGLKSVQWNDRLEWTLAAYDITKNRLLAPDPLNPGQLQQIGQRSSRGIEASLAIQLPGGWRIEANGTVLDARYDDFAENVGGRLISRNGKEPTNVPDRLANLWVSWAIDPHWLVQAGVRYVGSAYISNDNTREIPAYTLVDAGVHWDATRHFAMDVRLTNALDKFYAYSSSNAGNQWVLGAPRAVEVAVTANF